MPSLGIAPPREAAAGHCSPCRTRRRRFRASFRRAFTCTFWRLGFRQSSFRRVTRAPRAPRPVHLSAAGQPSDPEINLQSLPARREIRPSASWRRQCLKSVDRPGRGRTFPGDRMKVPSKTGAATLVGKVRPMLTVVSDSTDRDGSAAAAPSGSSLIDELVREGAQRMLAEALQAEVDAYCARFADERDENGRRLVVRNGYHEPRAVTTCAGAVAVHAPRVNDKRIDPEIGERQRFSSAILPPWARKTPQIEAVLPLLYLHGLSSGDFVPALGQFLGSTKGLSSSTITKLTETWQAEQQAFAQRDLSSVDYVYVWADGIHVNVRLEEAKLCLLVLIGVRADGRKELIALTDGYREATESWADLLLDAKRRGMG